MMLTPRHMYFNRFVHISWVVIFDLHSQKHTHTHTHTHSWPPLQSIRALGNLRQLLQTNHAAGPTHRESFPGHRQLIRLSGTAGRLSALSPCCMSVVSRRASAGPWV